jgi:hypothetical protein
MRKMAELNVEKTHKEEVEAAYRKYLAMGCPKANAKLRAIREVEYRLIEEDYDKREAGLPSNHWHF